MLEERSRAYTATFAEVIRARIVLLAADGECNTIIARRLDVHVSVVSRWRKRFFESGLTGLGDHRRAGRKRWFAAPVVAGVKAMACEPPEQRDVPLSVELGGVGRPGSDRGTDGVGVCLHGAPLAARGRN